MTASSEDHPRSRGVYRTPPDPAPPRWGSSPLARGLRTSSCRPRSSCRIIPARAGFTNSLITARSSPQDHPRSRGVYAPSLPSSGPFVGSSPLARGLLTSRSSIVKSARIIPARAGFTDCCWRVASRSADHPRSRGVYSYMFGVPRPVPGSSPLARGLQSKKASPFRYRGIIPARAGFTFACNLTYGRPTDHPRSRGVYEISEGNPFLVAGSSPLARGLPIRRRQVSLLHRIIPARAGFTLTSRPKTILNRDHPRSRGVYTKCAITNPSPNGSSPLARGLRSRRWRQE